MSESETRGIGQQKLASNLRAAIRASGLSRQQVAVRVDMDPVRLAEVLDGDRPVSSLDLALICTATGSDVLGILEAEPLHGPSYRDGLAQGWETTRRVVRRLADDESLSAVRRLDNIRTYLDESVDQS